VPASAQFVRALSDSPPGLQMFTATATALPAG